MALARSATSSSFRCGGCGSVSQVARHGAKRPQSAYAPRPLHVSCVADAGNTESRRDRNGARFTPRASPVLEELRLMTDAAAAAEADKGDWLSSLMRKLPKKQSAKQARRTMTGIEDPMKELFDYGNEHTPLEDRSKSSTVHGKQVYKTREEAPCGEYLFDLESSPAQTNGRNGKLRRDPNILPSQWDQELKRSVPPGSPAKLGGGLKDSLSKEQMLALAGASMVSEGDGLRRKKANQGNGSGDKKNVVQQLTSTIEHWAESVRK